uniref:MICOS complex subunit MIC10 n=1 Tax=Heterorhabditis bacteriophora TaxID=37862 RepID=A0A1I7WVV7_HETBA
MQIAMMAELEKNCGESDRSNTVEITLKHFQLTNREVEDVEDNFQLTKRQIEDVHDIFVSPSKEFLAELGFESSDDVYHAPASEIKDDKPKLIADAKFEDIHFSHLKGKKQDAVSLAAPRRIGPSLPYSGDSWAEQYKSQVNRRKMEIRGGIFIQVLILDILQYYRSSDGLIFFKCGFDQITSNLLWSNQDITLKKVHIDKCQQEHSQSCEPETIIDPKEFIEELSDSEDWNEVVALVNTPVPLKSSPQSLKRSVPSDNCGNSERPLKRSLLGGPPLTVLPPTHLPRVNRTNLSNHPASHHKPHDVSFFRMDLPSVVPKIAFENPKNVCDDTSIRSFDNEQGPYENNRGALKIDSDDSNTRFYLRVLLGLEKYLTKIFETPCINKVGLLMLFFAILQKFSIVDSLFSTDFRLIHGNCPPQSRIAPAISRGRQLRTDRFDQYEECDISSGAGWRHQGFSRRSSNWVNVVVFEFLKKFKSLIFEKHCLLYRCFADSLLKISGGVAIGIVASVAFFKCFKGRTWPIWFGSGVGLGTGWSNCRHDLAEPYLVHGKKVIAGQDTQGKPTYNIVVDKA